MRPAIPGLGTLDVLDADEVDALDAATLAGDADVEAELDAEDAPTFDAVASCDPLAVAEGWSPHAATNKLAMTMIEARM